MPSHGSDPIYLVGMMGAGKTVVGTALAVALGRRFIDLDRALEAKSGSTIAALFAAEGEHAFRDREARLLVELDAENAVVATGGGVVTRPENIELLLARGRVVYLRARPATILLRLARQAGGLASRPLLRAAPDAEDTLGSLWEQRRAAYERAHHQIDTDAHAPDAIVALIVKALGMPA